MTTSQTDYDEMSQHSRRPLALAALLTASMLISIAGVVGCSPGGAPRPSEPEEEIVRKFAISHDGRLLASLSSRSPNRAILIRNLATRERMHTLDYQDQRPIQISFHPLRHTLTAYYYEGNIVLWDLTGAEPTHRLIGRVTPHRPEGGTHAVLSNDGRLIAAADSSGAVVVWRVDDRRQISTFHRQDCPMALAFTPDGRELATAGPTGGIVLHDLETGAERTVPGSEKFSVRCAAFTPDGKRLTTTGFDGFVRMWNVADGVLERSERVELAVLACLQLSPNGRFAVVGTLSGDVVQVSLFTKTPPQVLRSHRNVVTDLTLTDDGRLHSSSLYSDVVSGSWIAPDE